MATLKDEPGVRPAHWRKLRIVELLNSLEFGGAERMAVDLAGELADRGHEVEVVCLREGGELEADLRDRGVPVTALRKPEGADWKTLRAMVTFLRRNRVDVLHTHNVVVHHYGAVGGRLAGAKAIVNTIHGIENLSQKIGAHELIFGCSCVLSDKVVAVCRAGEEAFRKHPVVPGRKLSMIPNGIDLDPFLALPLARQGSGITFGISGRLAEVKDHRSLILAFAEVVRQAPQCRLEILGDGVLRNELESLAASLNLKDSVRFLGFQSDVAPFLAKWNVFVLCSRSEALPLAMLEAMAAGLPVVGTAVGEIPALADGCGWICPPNSPERLAEAMLAAAKEPRLQALGRRSRDRVRETYSLARMADGYEDLFLSLA